jgi:hypothetical protein
LSDLSNVEESDICKTLDKVTELPIVVTDDNELTLSYNESDFEVMDGNEAFRLKIESGSGMSRTENGITPNFNSNGPIVIDGNVIDLKLDQDSFYEVANNQLTVNENNFDDAVYDVFDTTSGDGIAVQQTPNAHTIQVSVLLGNDSALTFDQGNIFVSADEKTINIADNNLFTMISAEDGNQLVSKDDGLFCSGFDTSNLNVFTYSPIT